LWLIHQMLIWHQEHKFSLFIAFWWRSSSFSGHTFHIWFNRCCRHIRMKSCLGGAADVGSVIEGRAAGGRQAVARCGVFVCCMLKLHSKAFTVQLPQRIHLLSTAHRRRRRWVCPQRS
jgi:hypothetical protein